MTNEEAARILDPETSREALAPWLLDCEGRMTVVEEACRISAEALRAQLKVERRPQWVSVTEQLPSDEKPVLAYYGFDNDGSGYLGMMFVGVLSYFCFDPDPHWQHADSNLVVTHWMPLPEGPEEAKDDG